MKMFKKDGTYWATLVSPDAAPTAISIGPWIFKFDISKGEFHEDPAYDGPAPYCGPVSYHNNPDV